MEYNTTEVLTFTFVKENMKFTTYILKYKMLIELWRKATKKCS